MQHQLLMKTPVIIGLFLSVPFLCLIESEAKADLSQEYESGGTRCVRHFKKWKDPNGGLFDSDGDGPDDICLTKTGRIVSSGTIIGAINSTRKWKIHNRAGFLVFKGTFKANSDFSVVELYSCRVDNFAVSNECRGVVSKTKYEYKNHLLTLRGYLDSKYGPLSSKDRAYCESTTTSDKGYLDCFVKIKGVYNPPILGD